MTTREEEAQCDTSTETRFAAIGGRPFSFDTSGDDSGEKRCPKCDTVKPLARFSKHQNRADGHQSVCKDCELVYRRRTQRESDLRRNFHMTLDDFAAMLASQRGGCAICGESTKRLVVDHDQSCCPSPDRKNARACGECTRGILCNRCNTGLGRYRDNIDRLLDAGWVEAAGYIALHRERRAERERIAS